MAVTKDKYLFLCLNKKFRIMQSNKFTRFSSTMMKSYRKKVVEFLIDEYALFSVRSTYQDEINYSICFMNYFTG